MKCDSPAEHAPLAEACCRLIDEYSFKERVIVECFDLPALEIIKSIDPEIKTAALFEPTFEAIVLSDQRSSIKQQRSAHQRSHSIIGSHASHSFKKQKTQDCAVAVWTVDDPTWIERARSMGIDALITNNPAAMLAHR